VATAIGPPSTPPYSFLKIIYPICSPRLKLAPLFSAADLSTLPLIQLDSRKWDCIDWQDWFEHFDVLYNIPQNANTFNQVTLSFNAATEGLGVSLGWEFMARQAIESDDLSKVATLLMKRGGPTIWCM
jgi:LysR family glycine cleavage system transcriptional activator